MQYFTEERVAYTCELLSEGNMDVNEVCLNRGFNNLSDFQKHFEKPINSMPGE